MRLGITIPLEGFQTGVFSTWCGAPSRSGTPTSGRWRRSTMRFTPLAAAAAIGEAAARHGGRPSIHGSRR